LADGAIESPATQEAQVAPLAPRHETNISRHKLGSQPGGQIEASEEVPTFAGVSPVRQYVGLPPFSSKKYTFPETHRSCAGRQRRSKRSRSPNPITRSRHRQRYDPTWRSLIQYRIVTAPLVNARNQSISWGMEEKKTPRRGPVYAPACGQEMSTCCFGVK
jgi:hypothetical protein